MRYSIPVVSIYVAAGAVGISVLLSAPSVHAMTLPASSGLAAASEMFNPAMQVRRVCRRYWDGKRWRVRCIGTNRPVRQPARPGNVAAPRGAAGAGASRGAVGRQMQNLGVGARHKPTTGAQSRNAAAARLRALQGRQAALGGKIAQYERAKNAALRRGLRNQALQYQRAINTLRRQYSATMRAIRQIR